MSRHSEGLPLLNKQETRYGGKLDKKILLKSLGIFVLIILIEKLIKPLFFPDTPLIIAYKKGHHLGALHSVPSRLLAASGISSTVPTPSRAENQTNSTSKASQPSSPLFLPYLASPPDIFKSVGQDSVWEGSFFTSQQGLMAPVKSGLVVLNFSTEPVTDNPLLSILLAESNHLDAKMLNTSINMRYSKYDLTKNTFELKADPGVEYVAQSTFKQWVKGHQIHQDHGITLRLDFGRDPLDKFGIVGQEVRFWMEIESLGFKLQGVARRGINQGTLEPVFPRWYVSIFVVVATGISLVIMWKIVHEGSQLLRPSETATGQGTISPFTIALINWNLAFITLKISEHHNSFFLAALRGFYLYLIILWSGLGLGVFAKIVSTLILYQGQFAYTMGRILFICIILMVFYHDEFFVSPYYDRALMAAFTYPLLQVVYIALFAKTSRHNYFVPAFHVVQYLGTLSLAYWYHGFGSTFLNLKPRPDVLRSALLTTLAGICLIFLQSVFGRFFCCCCPDNNVNYRADEPLVRAVVHVDDELEDVNDGGNPQDPLVAMLGRRDDLGPEINVDDPAEMERVLELIQQMERGPGARVPDNPQEPAAINPGVVVAPIQ